MNMTATSASTPDPTRGPSPVYEVDLRKYVLLVWRSRLPILASGILCAGLAFGLTLLKTPMYEAEVAMSATRSKLSDSGSADPSTASFRPFIENVSLASKVVREFKLDKPPANLTAREFLENRLSVQEVRSSTVLLVRCQMHDPKLASAVVNRVAELASDAVNRFGLNQATKSREQIREQYDEATAVLKQADGRLREFKDKNQLEVLRADVDAMLGQRGKLLALLIEVESEKARLARAEQELNARARIDTVTRSIDSDPQMLEAARKPSSSAADVLSLRTKNEYLNPVYQSLDQQVARTRTNLAALEQQKAEIVKIRKLDAAQLAAVSKLYQAEADLKRLDVERDLALRAYSEVALAYQTARLTIASRGIDFQVAEPAIEPDQPVSRHLGRNAGLGLIGGLLLSCVIALARSTLFAH